MSRNIVCPECDSTEISEHRFADGVDGGESFLYLTVVCENDHEFGVELEVATILN